MLPQKFSIEIFQKVENQDLLVKLIKQLNKDFNQIGLDYYFEEDTSPRMLVNKLREILESLLNDDFQTYINLLYRIDVSEAKLRKIEDIETEKISEKVATLILKREWQKVWFKSRIQ